MKKGFTLIELLVVISVIALLSSVTLAALNSARSKARDTQRIQTLHELRKANELRFHDVGSYAPTVGYFGNVSNLSAFFAALNGYIPVIPFSSSETARYAYVIKNYMGTAGTAFNTCLINGGWTADSSKYAFYAYLENAPTSNSNYISATQGDVYDRCLVQHLPNGGNTANYKAGN